MPDWFYRTVSRPVLFRLPAARARNFALGFIGRLARLPLGGKVIDFLGHMGPDERLQRTHLGIHFRGPVGLGAALDPHAVALPALARFGFGFLEAGPVAVEPPPSGPPRLLPEEGIWLPDPPETLALNAALPRLAEASRLGLPILARLASYAAPAVATSECVHLVRELAAHATLFSLTTLQRAGSAHEAAASPLLARRAPRIPARESWELDRWQAHVQDVVNACRIACRPLLLSLPADANLEEIQPLIDAALALGVAGLQIDGSIAGDQGCIIGLPARDPARRLVAQLRTRYGADLFLIAGGGVHEPADALELLAAGANLIQVDSGLVYTGPGLPKRINEAILFEQAQADDAPREPAERPAEMTWFWTTLMGGGMFVGALLALIIAATRVVLPYDEDFVGMTRAELDVLNPRLLAFLTHDRVSLAGTMVAIGILYLGLSLCGIRQGLHWAQQTVFISAFTGFASFFLFLGFGYLDPFHAFVTAVLLQLLLLGVHSRLGRHRPAAPPPLRGDPAWRRALWGQLLLVFHGFGLLAAGLSISLIGVTHVLVHEDLEFMQTTLEAIRAANPRLLPLIAHDRATMGGMLMAMGWAFLLPALWGFRTGSAWLWWTLLLAGCGAYTAALAVHYFVGYTDLFHLLPAFAGFMLLLVGLGLARRFLCSGGRTWPTS